MNEEYLKNKDEILELCEEWCKLNTHENDMDSLDRMQQIKREIEKRIYNHSEPDEYIARVITCDILSWYWNVMYLKDMTDTDWIMWWFFNIREFKEGTGE